MSVRNYKYIGLLIISVVMFGCTKSMNPVSSTAGSGNVTMSVAFSNTGSQVGLQKVGSVTGADSIRIDSAIIVFDRIKFEQNIDTVRVDSNGGDMYDDDAHDSSLVFWGPFVVHIRDTASVDFANQVVPAGTYTGIKLKVNRVNIGERFKDSDDFNHRPQPPDTSVNNYSIVIWGAIEKNGTWTPFEFKDNQELEFKIKGNFTVSSPTSTMNIALNFNMGSWFINPETGALLDPTDLSEYNVDMIQHAIRLSFENGRGGEDHNHDGHPDH